MRLTKYLQCTQTEPCSFFVWVLLNLAILALPNRDVQAVQSLTFTDVGSITGTNNAGLSWGSAWGDYDNDGDLDLYVVNRLSGDNRLYRNDGSLTFVEVAGELGLTVNTNAYSAYWGDYNNDGNLDLFTKYLYQNNGNSFMKVAQSVSFEGVNSYSGALADFDNDGDLDIFAPSFAGIHRLYQNNGGIFADRSIELGIFAQGRSRAAAWADFDNDGDLDLYVCRGSSDLNLPDLLYRNHDNSFLNVASGLGIQSSYYSVGADWGDFDNDGDLDLFVTTASGQPNQLYRNDGGLFVEIAGSLGLDNSNGFSLSPAWFDFDNDGDLDLLVSRSPGVTCLLYENRNGSFFEIQGDVGLGFDLGANQSASLGDFDNDGFLDIYLTNRYGSNYLFRNNTNTNNWLKVKCIGTFSTNRSAIGVRVQVSAGELTQIREISGGSGQASMHSLEAEFGLGDRQLVNEVEVIWTNGTRSTISNIAPNQTLIISESVQPLVLILQPSSVATTTATVHGLVNPNGLETEVHFEFGQTIDYGQEILADQSPLAGEEDYEVSAMLENLVPNQEYHLRLMAINSNDTTYSEDITFKTFANHLSIGSTVAFAGDEDIVIPIDLQNEVDLTSIAFNIEISDFLISGLTVTALRSAGRTVGQIQEGGINNDTGVNVFSIADFSGSPVISTGSGPIGEIVLEVADDAPQADILLRISNLNNFIDTNFNDISDSIGIRNGTLTIERYLLGDVDDNQVLQAIDAILIFRTATGLTPKPPGLTNPNLPSNEEIADLVAQRGDFNQDDEINFLDALDLFRAATGLPPRETQIVAKVGGANVHKFSNSKSLSLGTVETAVGSDSVVVPIVLQTDVNITSIAFDVSVGPENIQGIGIKQIRSAGRTSGQLQGGALDSSGTSATFAIADFSGGTVISADSGLVGELILQTEQAVSMDTIEIHVSNLNNVFDTNFNDISDSIVVSNGKLYINEQNPVGIFEEEAGMPQEYRLFSNYPNPFNPETTIKYSLPIGSPVTLEIFNLNGQLIAVLIDEFQPAGIYHTRWTGRDNKGNPTPSGIYVLRMKSNDFTGTTKILLLK